MDGLFHGKPYFLIDDLGAPLFLETPILLFKFLAMIPITNQNLSKVDTGDTVFFFNIQVTDLLTSNFTQNSDEFTGLCHVSGQIIATSHDLTPKGSLVREIPLFQ